MQIKKNWLEIGLGISVIIVLFAPFIITRKWPWPFPWPAVIKFDDTTGVVGDTIGGITAPIIGLLNAALLYYTLRKQNEQIGNQNIQITEQRLYVNLDRKMDYIRDTLASLELTITHPITESSDNLIIIGNHKGFATLSAVARLFKLNETNLSRYEIPEFDWTSFIIKIGYIISDAQSISRQNQSSSRDKSEKEEVYGALIMQLATIDIVFDIIDNFSKKYPHSSMLDKYQITKILRLRSASRNITLNKPK